MARVLLVDDESGIRFALRRFFERAQWLVEEAGDGVAALRILEASSGPSTDGVAAETTAIDLVLLDLHLPGVSGSEILERLATTHPTLVSRVILTTGDSVADAEPGSTLARHPHVLQKPFDLSTLRTKVAEICT